MKRIVGLAIILAMVTVVSPALFAQEERGEVSVFADYVRLGHADNYWGPGASLGINLNNYVQLEGAMAYDPERTIVQTYTSGTATTTSSAGLRLWHGEFGPKFSTGFHSAKLYAVLKGGFLNFSVSNASLPAGFANATGQFFNGDTHGVFYPGVGVEFGKRFGLKVEAGDLMYFDHGANHNLRIAVGPKFSF